MEDRLFGLDVQLLFDACVVFIVMMIMYCIMSNLFFKPVRAYMEQRAKNIADDHAEADKLEKEALAAKAIYDEKISVVRKEAEEILSASRKAAIKQQGAIIDQAKSEASAIMKQAESEADSEKQRISGDVRKEMASVAAVMAGQFCHQADVQCTDADLEAALQEMGGEAWQN